MYTMRISVYPTVGKLGEVQGLVEPHLKERQAQGVAGALSAQVFGEGQSLVIGYRFRDLAAVERFQRGNRKDAGFQAYQARLAPLLRAPTRVELLEVLSPAPPGQPPGYVQRVTIYPGLEQVGEVRRLLEEQTNANAGRDVRSSLARPVFSAEGLTFIVSVLHANLAALERVTRQAEADASVQAFFARLRAAIRRPSEIELFEVLIPFPS